MQQKSSKVTEIRSWNYREEFENRIIQRGFLTLMWIKANLKKKTVKYTLGKLNQEKEEIAEQLDIILRKFRDGLW